MTLATAGTAQILVVEDEGSIRQLLRTTLEAEGYVVHEAPNAPEGQTLAGNRRVDLFLIDLGLPDADGLTLIRHLRSWTQRPIVVLSARTEELQKVEALDAGADDFVTKPFGVAELHARLRVALRHAQQTTLGGASVVRLGGCTIDLGAKSVVKDGLPVRLTATQWQLLEVFCRHAGRVVTSQQLLKEGDSVNQMMQVTGEEGVTLEDFVRYQQSLFVDMVYLQQDGFDSVDAAVPIERQKQAFALIRRVLDHDYRFQDKEQVREMFVRLTGLFKNLNYARQDSKEYETLTKQIEALRAEQ